MRFLVLIVILIVFGSVNVSGGKFFDFVSEKVFKLSEFFKSASKSVFPESINIEQHENFSNQIKFDERKRSIVELSTRKNQQFDSRRSYSISQQAILHGMSIVTHTTLTEDGYFLTMHRVHGQKHYNSDSVFKNQTVLLHHGLLGSSADWILLGAEESLPYKLVRAGCDVWLANARGNYYSRSHISKSRRNLDFWKFSWQEIGESDLSAVIDYINTVRNSTDPISYIGHSLGATALLTLLSTKPQYNKAIRIGIFLAPLAFMANSDGPFDAIMLFNEQEIEMLKLFTGRGEFKPNLALRQMLMPMYCKNNSTLCENTLLLISGVPKDGENNASYASKLLKNVPTIGSADTIYHYLQVGAHDKFHRYYNETSEFALHKVTVPIALICSRNDWLSTVPDVTKLYSRISNPVHFHIIEDPDMVHTDFVWGINANKLVFIDVIKILRQSLSNKIEFDEVLDY